RLSPGGFEPWAALLVLVPAAALPWCLFEAQVSRTPLVPLVASLGVLAVLLLPGGLHMALGVPALDALLMQPRLRTPLEEGSPAVETLHRAADPARAVGFDRTLMQGSQALYRVEGIGGADALEVPAYAELIDASGMSRSMTW